MHSADESSAPGAGELSQIPQNRRDAARAALKAVFGTKGVGEMRAISGGVSGAPILRFDVDGRAYVLRLEPERIALHHRQRHFACMASAAAVGAAPALHYADAEAGLAIMDCITGRPLADYPGGPAALVRGLGALIARVQMSAPFPVTGDYPLAIATMLAALDASGLFPAGSLDRHADGLVRIRAVLPWDATRLVSTHNDPNPRNILFDGERLWLIDWELAGRNDPLVDIAILTLDLAETVELEDALLAAAFGKASDRAVRARLAAIRLLTRLFYGCIVLENFMQAPRRAPDQLLDQYTQASFRAAIANGTLASGSQDVAYAFGKMSLTMFAAGIRNEGFDALLDAVKQS